MSKWCTTLITVGSLAGLILPAMNLCAQDSLGYPEQSGETGATYVDHAEAAEIIDYTSGEDFSIIQQNLRERLADEGQKFGVSDPLFESDNYFGIVVHREDGPGFGELHREWTDIYFVTSGAATLIVGGEVTDAKETAPGEIRGTGVFGGKKQLIKENDVVHIPSGVAHEVDVAVGEHVTYLILKVRAK